MPVANLPPYSTGISWLDAILNAARPGTLPGPGMIRFPLAHNIMELPPTMVRALMPARRILAAMGREGQAAGGSLGQGPIQPGRPVTLPFTYTHEGIPPKFGAEVLARQLGSTSPARETAQLVLDRILRSIEAPAGYKELSGLLDVLTKGF